MDRGIERDVSNADPPSSFFRGNARYFFALVFCLLLLQDVFGPHGLMAMHRSKAQIEAIQAKIDTLDQENRDLQQRIQNLKTDPSAVEKIARDRMGLARPGELIFSLPPKSDKHPPTTPARP
ncbi:MAG TPA: septum formation initiator family protein [Candidatus Acidoferrales bacterium]|nr:septum formation initiator family protein [Candidatus Acidoferrales bacterium]